MTSATIECPIQVKAQGSKIAGRRRSPLPLASRRVPRITRLLALAHKLDGLVSQGVVAGYAALAGLGHVSRARLSQIMSLLNLAPEFQEVILFLPPTLRGRDVVHLRDLLPIAQVLDWADQRARWRRQARLSLLCPSLATFQTPSFTPVVAAGAVQDSTTWTDSGKDHHGQV